MVDLITEALKCRWTGPGVNFRTVRSPQNFALDALKSALQKYIRRSEVAKAVFCAREIHCISASQIREDETRSPRAQAVLTNLMHRLFIIFMEDCGPPSAQWTEFVVNVAKDVILLGRDSPVDNERLMAERMAITTLTAALARMNHSRFFSHIGNVFAMSEALDNFARIDARFHCLRQLRYDAQFPISDEEFNSHTLALSNVDRITPNDFRHLTIFEKSHRPEAMDTFDYIEKIIKDSREVFLVPMMNTAYCIYHHKHTIPNATCFKLSPQEIAEFDSFVLPQLDDYTLDLHTSEGRAHGSHSRAQFALSGARVTNENPKWIIPVLEEFYLISKRIQDGEVVRPMPMLRPIRIPTMNHNLRLRESDLFELVAHAQLTTGMGKTDTYFARIRTDDDIGALCTAHNDSDQTISRKLQCARIARHELCPHNARATIFVKGPLVCETIRNAIEISLIKRMIFPEIPAVHLAYWFCDEFDLFTSPIGQRVIHSRNPTGIWGLLLAPNVSNQGTGHNSFTTEIRTSNVYGPTEVVKWSENDIVTNAYIQQILEERNEQQIEYVQMAYIFRFTLAIGDGALRNLIRSHDGKIVAVDEDLIRNPAYQSWYDYVNSLGSNAIKELLIRPFSEHLRKLKDMWIQRMGILKDNMNTRKIDECFDRLMTIVG